MKVIEIRPGVYRFTCPGCGEQHDLPTPKATMTSPKWEFNGDLDKPTFKPSIFYRSGHFAPHFRQGVDQCWCQYNLEHKDNPAPFACASCHSFVTNGKIEFLNDSSHALAGKTVELPDIVS